MTNAERALLAALNYEPFPLPPMCQRVTDANEIVGSIVRCRRERLELLAWQAEYPDTDYRPRLLELSCLEAEDLARLQAHIDSLVAL